MSDRRFFAFIAAILVGVLVLMLWVLFSAPPYAHAYTNDPQANLWRYIGGGSPATMMDFSPPSGAGSTNPSDTPMAADNTSLFAASSSMRWHLDYSARGNWTRSFVTTTNGSGGASASRMDTPPLAGYTTQAQESVYHQKQYMITSSPDNYVFVSQVNWKAFTFATDLNNQGGSNSLIQCYMSLTATGVPTSGSWAGTAFSISGDSSVIATSFTQSWGLAKQVNQAVEFGYRKTDATHWEWMLLSGGEAGLIATGTTTTKPAPIAPQYTVTSMWAAWGTNGTTRLANTPIEFQGMVLDFAAETDDTATVDAWFNSGPEVYYPLGLGDVSETTSYTGEATATIPTTATVPGSSLASSAVTTAGIPAWLSDIPLVGPLITSAWAWVWGAVVALLDTVSPWLWPFHLTDGW